MYYGIMDTSTGVGYNGSFPEVKCGGGERREK